MAQAAPERARTGIDHVTYEDLYRRWEKGNWSATDIDFSQDRVDWHETFSDFERRAALWNYANFFHGEDAVTDTLSPYIDAAPREEQRFFLTTQQVDEARHTVFFNRFMQEVVGTGGNSIANSLDATRPELTWGYYKLFELLDSVADELRKDRSIPNFAASLVVYHLVIEATLAEPGQDFIESYLSERGVLPGFVSGFRNLMRDEQRHIGFGVKCLSDLVKQDPECKYAVADMLRRAEPYMRSVFVPPNFDRRYTEVFGRTLEQIYEHGLTSLWQKLRTAGMPVEELPGPPIFPRGLSAGELAARAIELLQAGYIDYTGKRNGPAARDPEKIALMFDTMRRGVDTTAAPNGGVTIAWEFEDVDPYYLRIANGSSESGQGLPADADLVLRCSFDDWVEIAARRSNPRVAMATRKLRPKGSLRLLLRMPKLIGR